MDTIKLTIVSVVVFLSVVFAMWHSYDLGYEKCKSDQIATYNDGFIDGQNNNTPH